MEKIDEERARAEGEELPLANGWEGEDGPPPEVVGKGTVEPSFVGEEGRELLGE